MEGSEYEDSRATEDAGLLYAKRLAIAEKILSKRDDAVTHRAGSGVERRWREDEEMIDDFSTSGPNYPAPVIDYATGRAFKQPGTMPQESTIKINVIRGRCEIAEGRFGEISLPTDDRNWSLKRTPVPEMAEVEKSKQGAFQDNKEVVDQNGQHATVGEVAREYNELADKKMKKMELVIDDQLTECDFNAEQRKCQKNSVRLGTGILKGPSVIKKINSKYIRVPVEDEETGEQAVKDGKLVWDWEIEAEESNTPASKSIDPRCVYPDSQCGNDIKKAGYIFEVDTMRPNEVAALDGVRGYDSKMIQEVLEEEPTHVDVIYDDKVGGYRTVDRNQPKGSLYQKWEYNGGIDRSDLEDLGCDVEAMGITASKVTACIIFINDKPVKSVLNTLDTNELPYDFFPWTEVDGSPFGIGLPRRGRDLQRVIFAAWRKMMDNAGDSSGVNVVLAEGIEPVDGQWTLDGKKAWRALTDSAIDDVRKSFATFQADNRQPELADIIEMALKFLDIETGIPQIFQGEMQKQPETLGQTNIIVDSSNISLRSRMKLYDDKILDPHLTRYYHYNMQYNPDESIKGDYQVDSRGTRVLLERDVQAVKFANLFQFKADPDINAWTNWDKVIPQWYADMKLQGVLNTETEHEAKIKQQSEAGQKEDPAVEAAKIRAQGQKMELEGKNAIQGNELKFKAEQAQLDRQESEKDRLFQIKMKEMDREIEFAKLTQDTNKSDTNVKRSLTETSAKLNTQKEISFGTDKAKQVATPATEPPEHAEDGEAYEH